MTKFKFKLYNKLNVFCESVSISGVVERIKKLITHYIRIDAACSGMKILYFYYKYVVKLQILFKFSAFIYTCNSHCIGYFKTRMY